MTTLTLWRLVEIPTFYDTDREKKQQSLGMSGISRVCLLPGSGENDTGEHTVYGRSSSSSTIVVCRSRINAARGPEWNWSHRLRYHVYFIPSNVQLKDKIVFAYTDNLMTEVATRADWEAGRVVEAYV